MDLRELYYKAAIVQCYVHHMTGKEVYYKHGIKIYPVPQGFAGKYSKCKITVEKQGVVHNGDMLYDQKNGELGKKIFELYEFYYKQIEGKI